MSKQEATRLADALRRCADIDFDGDFGAAAALLDRWPDGDPVAWQLSNARVALSNPSSTMAAVYEQDGFLVALKVPYGPPFYSRTALIEAIDGAITKLLSPAPPAESERIAALEAENAEWKAKAATWLASPEAASRLQGYRELTDRIAALEAALEQARVALERIRHATAPTHDDGGHHEAAHDLSIDALRAIEEVRRG